MVVEMARCLLKSMAVPGLFWGEAVKTAVYLLNRAPSRSLNGVTPYEAWHGRKPNVQHLRTFGCVAHAKKLGPGLHKLADCSTPCIFVGYEEGSKAYRVYDPVGKRLIVTRDVAFEERHAWKWDSETNDTDLRSPATFAVEYATEDEQLPKPTTETSAMVEPAAETPATNAEIEGSRELACGDAGEPATPSPVQVEFTTPHTHDSNLDMDSGGLHRYMRLTNIFDTTSPFRGELELELGLTAADEPTSVEAALADPS
jgi:hypothetical protein